MYMRSVVLLALAALLSTGNSFAQVGDQGARAIEEIVVTAARREQDVQDVAAGIEVFDGELIDQLGIDEFEDYFAGVAGASFTKQGMGSVRLGMRGITNIRGTDLGVTDGVSTVGLYLDEVPISGSGPIPDLDLYDLARVEVLKGPQGTLYGEGAVGGAVRMITRKPHFDGVEFKGEITGSDVADGGTNTKARGVLNVPLVQDVLAARLVASFRDDEGFIDNVVTGEDDINSAETFNARLSLLFEPNDWFSGTLVALHQDTDEDDTSATQPDVGKRSIGWLETTYNDTEFDLYALTLEIDLGFATLSSNTSIWELERTNNSRFPVIDFGALIALFGATPVPPGDNNIIGYIEGEGTTQEFRLVSNGDNTIDYIVGGFWRERTQDVCIQLWTTRDQAINTSLNEAGFGVFAFPDSPADEICPPPSGRLSQFNRTGDEDFEQIALYGEISWDVTSDLELSFGIRWWDEDIGLEQQQIGWGIGALLARGDPISSESVNDDGVSGKIGATWRFSDDHMIYASVGNGFRSGGVNLNGVIFEEVSSLFESDELTNFEVGSKNVFADGRVTANVAIYHQEWDDIQLGAFATVPISPASPTGTIFITDNVGEAEVDGIEVETRFLIADDLEFGITFSVLDSEITKVERSDIIEGQDLPQAPELNVSAYIEKFWELWDGQAYARISGVYVDDQSYVADSTAAGAVLPPESRLLDSYSTADARIGWQGRNWGADVFLNNLTDEEALVGIAVAQTTAVGVPPAYGTIQPRTIGLTIRYNTNN